MLLLSWTARMSKNLTASIETCTMHYGVQDPTVKSGFRKKKDLTFVVKFETIANVRLREKRFLITEPLRQ